jgi:flagellar motor switch protein FliG
MASPQPEWWAKNKMEENDSLQNAAILMMTLGEMEAAEVFKHLSPKEVQKLGEAIAKTKVITREKVDEVVEKFTRIASAHSLLVSNSGDYVRSVLKLALGDDKAALLIDRILQGGDVSGIESLKWMDPASVAEMLRNEHPQIVAAILVHLDYDQASDVIKLFPERQRNEVMLRVATMEGIQPSALKDLNEILFKVLAGGEKVRKSSLGGVKTAAEMINLMGTAIEGTVIESIRSHDPDLAQKIMDKMFVFDDVNKLDSKAIQLILKEVATDALTVALKGAQPALKEKFLSNMSSRAAENLREDLESRGPMRLSEVEAQQKEILKIVRRLADEGTVVLGGGGDDAMV